MKNCGGSWITAAKAPRMAESSLGSEMFSTTICRVAVPGVTTTVLLLGRKLQLSWQRPAPRLRVNAPTVAENVLGVKELARSLTPFWAIVYLLPEESTSLRMN